MSFLCKLLYEHAAYFTGTYNYDFHFYLLAVIRDMGKLIQAEQTTQGSGDLSDKQYIVNNNTL